MDVIQFKWEINRTISFTGTNIDPPDADPDPFTALTIDGSATDGGLYLMDEGSGGTLNDSSSFNHDITIPADSKAPDWAPAADPSFPSAGVARYSFASVEGYDLRHSDAPNVVHQPRYQLDTSDKTSGELRLRLKPPVWWEDGTSPSGWSNPSPTLASSTTQSFESGASIRTSNSTNFNSRDIPQFGTESNPFKRWVRAWFYDPGGTDASRKQLLSFYQVALGTQRISVGVDIATSSTHYTTFVSGPGSSASSVAFSVGWHEF
jgi:hypothetical protein